MSDNYYNPEKKHAPKNEPKPGPETGPKRHQRVPQRPPSMGRPTPIRMPDARMEMRQAMNVQVKAGVRQVTQVPYVQVVVGDTYANIPTGDAMMFAATTYQVATMAYVDAVLLAWLQLQYGYSTGEAWEQLTLFQEFRQTFAAQQQAMQEAAGMVPPVEPAKGEGE